MASESDSAANELSLTGSFSYRGFARPSNRNADEIDKLRAELHFEYLSYTDTIENAQVIRDFRSR